jgi:hypothetical protein
MLEEICSSIVSVISSMLIYEQNYRRIVIQGQNSFSLFQDRAMRFGINAQEIQGVFEILQIFEKHKESSVEFIKNEKLVMLGDNLNTSSIDLSLLKRYLAIAKIILQKVKGKIKEEREAIKLK